MAKKIIKGVNPEAVTAWQLTIMFIMTAAFGMILMFLGNVYMPQGVVLGNHIFSPGLALIYSMITFSLLSVGAAPVIEWIMLKNNLHPTENIWMVMYLGVNFAALWIVARFAEFLGLGIASWRIVLVLAFIIDILQASVLEMVMEKK